MVILALTALSLSSGATSASASIVGGVTVPTINGSSWMGGNGVNACSMTGTYGTDYNSSCGGQSAIGSAWQCVELAQRLYYTRGWFTANGGYFWDGHTNIGHAYQIWSDASAMGMSTQANGSITSIVPGDMIIHDVGTGGSDGHVAIVDYVGSDGVHVVEQNYGGMAHEAVYGYSGGTLTRTLYNTAGHLMPILGVVHSPNNTSAGGYADGTFLHATDTGNVYKVAGGSPTYVPSWASVGLSSQPALTNVTQATINAMPQYPANGTFVQDYSTSNLWEVVGGALMYVTSWSNVGGTHPYVIVSDWAITHQFQQYPSDGTYLADGTSGYVYVMAGGAPMRIYSWSDIGGSEPTTEVDDWAIFNDLLHYPGDGTYIVDYATSNVYVVAGGAPMRVFSWSDVGGSHQVVTLDDEAIQDNLLAYPADNTCIASYSSGDAYIVAGRAPMLVTSWSNIGGSRPCTTVDNEDLTTQLDQYPIDGTVIRNYGTGAIYVVAGGCALSIQSMSNVPYTTYIDVDGNAISNQLLSYPANGTLVEGYVSGHEYLIVSQAAVLQSPATGSPTMIDDWAVTNQLGV